LLLCFVVFAGYAGADTKGNNEKGDTLRATEVPIDTVVGESYIFQSIDYLTEDKLFSLIDSLLDLDKVPVALIHEIELYVNSKYEKDTDPVITTTSKSYPASQYYDKWDTYNTHPYSESLSKNDTILELVLTTPGSPYVAPVIGTVTSNFGDGRNHSGMDIDLQVWDTVVSAFDGVVRIARKHGGYGRVVVIRHYNGLETLYAHLHRIKVEIGKEVKAGDLIGLGGSSGKSTGSHLHWECRFKGKPLNPRHFINFRKDELINDTIVLNRTKWSYGIVPKGVQYHRVQKGEFLYLIAKRYGTSITRLCQLNGISRNSILRVGQKLRIS